MFVSFTNGHQDVSLRSESIAFRPHMPNVDLRHCFEHSIVDSSASMAEAFDTGECVVSRPNTDMRDVSN